MAEQVVRQGHIIYSLAIFFLIINDCIFITEPQILAQNIIAAQNFLHRFVCLFIFSKQTDCPADYLTASLAGSSQAFQNNTHSVTARRRMNGVIVQAAQSRRPRCPNATETALDEQDEGPEGRSCQSQQRFSVFLATALHLRQLRYHAVCLVGCFFMFSFLCLIGTDWLHCFAQQQSDICLSCCTEKMDYICSDFPGAINYFVKLVG